MAKLCLTRRYRFSASHRLHAPRLGDGRNREIYGKCNNPHGHGHDYLLEVTVSGRPDPRTGRLIAVAALDRFVARVVLNDLDRSNLNSVWQEFRGDRDGGGESCVPTTENLARVVGARLQAAWDAEFDGAPARLEKLRIHETKRNIFEVRVNAPEARQERREAVESTILKVNR